MFAKMYHLNIKFKHWLGEMLSKNQKAGARERGTACFSSFHDPKDNLGFFFSVVCLRAISATSLVFMSTSHHLQGSAVIFRCLLSKLHIFFSLIPLLGAAAATEPNSHQHPTGCFGYYIHHRQMTRHFSRGLRCSAI